MPGFDGTGPQGEGPLTGGARGQCVTDEPGGRGRGRGPGWNGRGGGGYGVRRRIRGGWGRDRGMAPVAVPVAAPAAVPAAVATAESDEATRLRQQNQELEQQLALLQSRVARLEQEKE